LSRFDLVSPFPVGGPNDAIARTLAESLRSSLGQPVIVENVSGASGSIRAGRVARAAPDGYTILSAGWVSQVLNGAVYQLPYDVTKDFDPVALLTTSRC
jgi:tripartite-type tricarboxylate transporter receptor subunit TctC